MSRKSFVRERCDIFENDSIECSNDKSNDIQGKQQQECVENHQHDMLNNKRPTYYRRSTSGQSISNIQTIHNSDEDHQTTILDLGTKFDTITDRIGKLSLDTTIVHSRRHSARNSFCESNVFSSSPACSNYYKYGTKETTALPSKDLYNSNASSGASEKRDRGIESNRYSAISTNSNILNTEKKENIGVYSKHGRNSNFSRRVSENSNNVRGSFEFFMNPMTNEKKDSKVGKLNLSSYEKFISENQVGDNTFTYKVSSCGSSNEDVTEIKDIRLSDHSKNTEFIVDGIFSTLSKSKSPLPNKRFLRIPPKPKYINKIRANPNMSLDSKQQLQEKIKIFNELTNCERAEINRTKKNVWAISQTDVKGDVEDDVMESCHESTKSNDDNNDSSEESSDDDMVAEYDIMENLNVTKITVEKRYHVPDHEKRSSTYNVTRETYYDHNLNPRIEHISRNIRKEDESSENTNTQSFRKSLLIIQELTQTELSYYKGLLHVYENYITYFRSISNSSSPNISKVFGNLEEIYKQQIHFYDELVKCNSDVEALAETFLKNDKLFNLYEKYIVNKHTSSKYLAGECFEEIKARDQELGQKLNLESYLLTPVQRLFKYLMLLKNLREALVKERRECLKLESAVGYLEKLIENTNTHARVIQRIQDSPIDFSRRGKYLLSDDFILKNNRKKYNSTVILLEDIIIFTHKVDDETYDYKDSINLSDLYVRSIVEDLTSFQLQNFTEYKLKPDNKYVFDLEVTDPNIKNEWVKKIESLLWNQFAAHKRC